MTQLLTNSEALFNLFPTQRHCIVGLAGPAIPCTRCPFHWIINYQTHTPNSLSSICKSMRLGLFIYFFSWPSLDHMIKFISANQKVF